MYQFTPIRTNHIGQERGKKIFCIWNNSFWLNNSSADNHCRFLYNDLVEYYLLDVGKVWSFVIPSLHYVMLICGLETIFTYYTLLCLHKRLLKLPKVQFFSTMNTGIVWTKGTWTWMMRCCHQNIQKIVQVSWSQ